MHGLPWCGWLQRGLSVVTVAITSVQDEAASKTHAEIVHGLEGMLAVLGLVELLVVCLILLDAVAVLRLGNYTFTLVCEMGACLGVYFTLLMWSGATISSFQAADLAALADLKVRAASPCCVRVGTGTLIECLRLLLPQTNMQFASTLDAVNDVAGPGSTSPRAMPAMARTVSRFGVSALSLGRVGEAATATGLSAGCSADDSAGSSGLSANGAGCGDSGPNTGPDSGSTAVVAGDCADITGPMSARSAPVSAMPRASGQRDSVRPVHGSQHSRRRSRSTVSHRAGTLARGVSAARNGSVYVARRGTPPPPVATACTQRECAHSAHT